GGQRVLPDDRPAPRRLRRALGVDGGRVDRRHRRPRRPRRGQRRPRRGFVASSGAGYIRSAMISRLVSAKGCLTLVALRVLSISLGLIVASSSAAPRGCELL